MHQVALPPVRLLPKRPMPGAPAPAPAFRPPLPRHRADPGPATAGTDWRWFSGEARLGTARGSEILEAWNRKRGRGVKLWPLIREEFEDFRHEALFRLTQADMRAAHMATEHALGKLRPADERPAEDWSGDVPFVYVFHRLLEEEGRMPLWQDVVRFVTLCPGLLLRRYWLEMGLSEGSPEAAWDGSPEMRAFHYRLGKAYYSFFREVHLMTLLRDRHGVDLGYHFLLDSEWRIDFVSGDVLVELYMENGRYKDRTSSRKPRCAAVNPGRKCVVLMLPKPTEYGEVSLVPNGLIAEAAERILAAGGKPIAGHGAFSPGR